MMTSSSHCYSNGDVLNGNKENVPYKTHLLDHNVSTYYGAISKNDDEEDNDALITTSTIRIFSSEHAYSMFGIFFIMLGSFSFSCMFLLVKLMQGKADTFTLVFYRSLVQILLSLGPILSNGENPLGVAGGHNRGWLFVRGGFGSGAVIAWFYGIQHLPLPDAVTLQFTTPVFAAVFAVCLVGEEWKRLDMVGAVICLLGVCLIAHPTWLFGRLENVTGTISSNMTFPPTETIDTSETIDNTTIVYPMHSNVDDSSRSNSSGLAVAVTTAGAAMAGLAYVAVRLIRGTSANVMVLYYATFSIPMVLVGNYELTGTWQVWFGNAPFTPLDYLLLSLTGLAGYGGQFFTNLGLQRETAATGTLVTSTQIVWTYIFEMLFLQEDINGWSLAGTGLILGFMIVVGISKVTTLHFGKHDNEEDQSAIEENDYLIAQSDKPSC